MKLIVDKEKQLNYNPLVVYFILNISDRIRYSDTIEAMNEYNGFTRDLFQFHIIEGDKYYSGLSENIAESLSDSNVIVRLVDDNEGNYNYCVERIDFYQSSLRFEADVKDFMLSVIEQNIKNLSSQIRVDAGDAEDEDENDLLSGSIKRLNIASSLNNNKSWKEFRNPPIGRIDSYGNCRSMEGTYMNWMPMDIQTCKDKVSDKLQSDPEIKELFEKMVAYFEENMGVPSIEESDSIALGTVDDLKSQHLILDQKSREKSDITPDIRIAITKVKGKKFEYGFEIKINDADPILLYLGSKEASFNYLLTLLKQKRGERMYKNLFKHKLSDMPGAKKNAELIWMEKVYNKMFANDGVKFAGWYKYAGEKSCHAINQGKGYANRMIKELLYNYPDAIWYCSINNIKSPSLYYYIDIPADHIFVNPKELALLI